MKIERLFDGVFRIDRKICTANLVKGTKVYDEELVHEGSVEYRTWNPYRSKLSAALVQGLKEFRIRRGSQVLYLGAATGTTSSHISDIVGPEGAVYCVELSERNMRELLKVCESRENMMPIFHDARDVEDYSGNVGKVDAVYQDVSARDQDEILLRNSVMLKENGYAYVAIKSQSIDISKSPKQVFDEFIRAVEPRLKVVEKVDIDRFDKKHLFVVFKKVK